MKTDADVWPEHPTVEERALMTALQAEFDWRDPRYVLRVARVALAARR
jgi:hypothetical protein